MQIVKMNKESGITIQITKADLKAYISENTVADDEEGIMKIYDEFFEAAKDPIRVSECLKEIEDCMKDAMNLSMFELNASADFLVE